MAKDPNLIGQPEAKSRSIWQQRGGSPLPDVPKRAPNKYEDGRASPLLEQIKIRNGLNPWLPEGERGEEAHGKLGDERIRTMVHVVAGISENLRRISDHMRKEIALKRVMDDWRFVAIVFDRLCLFIFSAFLFTSTCLIFSAPHYVDEHL